MENLICHVSPTGGIDDRIAQFLDNGYTKEDIGTLRGLYDMDNKEPLISPLVKDSDIQGKEFLEIADKLMKYKSKQVERHKKEMSNSSEHMARTFNQLYHVPGWNAATRRNRINMIASEFTAEVSRRIAAAKEAGVSITREQVVNGYKSNGLYHEGQLSIFEAIFDKFLNRYSEAREIIDDFESLSAEDRSTLEEADYRDIELARKIVAEYPKIFQNWAALCTFARMSLRDTESLKLGQTLEYAAPTSPDNFSMDSPLEDTYDLEESVRDAWMIHRSEISAFGSLGSEIRRFLSTIADVDEEGHKITDDLGYSQKMDPVETHQYLADILRGVTSESNMIKKLQELSGNDPRVQAIFTALAKAAQADLNKSIDNSNKPKNPVILTQLLLDMHKNLVLYSALLRKGSNIYAKILNKKSNSLYDEFILRMQLNHQVDPATSIYDKGGLVDWEKLAQWNVESAALLPTPEKSTVNSSDVFKNLTRYNSNSATGFWALSNNQRIDYMKRAARAIGIPMTDKAARRIYNNPTLRKSYLTALQEFRTETRNVYKGDVLNALKVIEKYQGNRPRGVEESTEYDLALASLKGRSISYRSFREKTFKNTDKGKGVGNDRIIKALNALADVSEYLKTERRVSWFDRKGKANSRYSDRTPSYMGDLVGKIHEFAENKEAQGLKDFIMDKWGRSSFFYDKATGRFLNKWIQELYDSITIDSKGIPQISDDALAKVFEFDEFLGSNIDKNVTIFENFTEKQHAEAMIKQFVQLLDQSRGRSNLAKYPCFILGDSGAQMFFTARRYSHDEIMDGLRDTFKQEIERMKYVQATNKVLERLGYKTIDNFSQTANEFTMLKFFNPDYADGKYWKILTGNQDMTDAELKTLSKEKAVEQAKESIDTDALTEALQTYMDDALADFKKKLASVGVLTESKGEWGVITYTDPKGYFSQNIQWWNNSLDELIKDFYWNTKYATVQQLQLFTVDPSFYDHRYPIKDLQKRYKEIYAPGKGISVEARDYNGNLFMDRAYETAVYFDDIKVSSEDVNPYFMRLMEDTFGKDSAIANAYKKNTLTDGQGYRTLESYRAVKGMAGEWTMAMENAYNRIMDIRNSGNPITDADIREMAQLAVIFQPIKPYLYTLEKLKVSDDGDMALIPVQHKYAEIVLIPELMQDGKLKDMAIWMENHKDEQGNAAPIDLVCSTKCVKVGSFGSVDFKGANTTEAINATLDKAFIHKLSWSDYRIQSGIPEHLNHAQLFGTQIRKLILANIDKSKTYDYLNKIFGVKDGKAQVYIPGMGNVNLTGRNLISFYNSLIMANMFDSYDRFNNESATNQALSDKMIQNVISNTNQSEDNAFGLSLIDEGDFEGEFLIPLGEPGMEHDASALLFSLFKKAVNKQKIKGGSAVQASSMGLSGYEESGDLFEVVSPEGDNVLYDEIEMPFNLSYTSATGKSVALKFEDWCNPDGSLKMSDKIVYGEDAREYLSWPVSGRDEHGKAIDPSQGYYIPLIETKYPGILDIVAYRIPTERDYSMINCKVFRFSNPLAGGTMKVPSSRTTTAGFDFDIDKLYFFMREFAQTHLTDKQIEDIWQAIYNEHKDWKIALQEARSRDALGKELISAAAEMFKGDLAGSEGLNQSLKARERLYNYWEAAGLEGTPEEAFTKYLENHRDEYPIFDVYNPQISPLNPVKDKKGNVITAGNSRVARNNVLIDLIRARLMDKETLKARYTPGGFENNRDAALRMRVLQFADTADITTNGTVDWAKVDAYVDSINKGDRNDPEPEYDVSDPTAILVYNQQNQVAGKLIGIFANQNTNHVYASTMHELALREPIRFGNHTTRGLSDLLHAPDGIDVDTNVAEYLAASVDAVKDPVLNFLNLNLVTADAGALLARIGYTPQEIGLLFNQPIIKDICDYVANENVTTDVAITEMLRKYGGSNASLERVNFDASRVTSEKLADNILKQRGLEDNIPSEFKQGQLQVLWLFNELMANTADLNSFVQATRFTAANSVGSTWGEQLAQEERVQKFIDKYMKDYTGDENDPRRLSFTLFDPTETMSNRVVSLDEAVFGDTNQGILNIDEHLLDLSPEEYLAQMSRNPLAFEQCMMDLSRKATRTLFKKHFPYYTQLYNNMRNIMSRLTKYGGLDADTINSLHREFMVFLLSKQIGSSFDGDAPNAFVGGEISNREYYNQWYPSLLHVLKTEGSLESIPFFNALSISGDWEAKADSEPLQITVQGMGGLQSRTINLITEAWAEAYNSDAVIHSDYFGGDIPVKQLAEDFYFYNFYKMGYNYHPTSSMSLAPTLLKLGLRITNDATENGYIDFIRKVIDGKVNMDSTDLISFAKQYMLNHLDNKKFVFAPTGSARTAVSTKAYNEQTSSWNREFSISLSSLGKDTAKLFTLKDDSLREGAVAFRPIIAIERGGTTAYYMADSGDAKFNVTTAANGAIKYKLVQAQGIKGKNIQYFSHSSFEAYQRNGTAYNTNTQIKKTNDDISKAIEDGTTDGTPMEVPEVIHIEIGDNIESMFSDAEWNKMFQEFRNDHPELVNREEYRGFGVSDFKHMMLDTLDSQNVQILNDLANRIDRGEKMKTIDEKGEEINVC